MQPAAVTDCTASSRDGITISLAVLRGKLCHKTTLRNQRAKCSDGQPSLDLDLDLGTIGRLHNLVNDNSERCRRTRVFEGIDFRPVIPAARRILFKQETFGAISGLLLGTSAPLICLL